MGRRALARHGWLRNMTVTAQQFGYLMFAAYEKTSEFIQKLRAYFFGGEREGGCSKIFEIGAMQIYRTGFKVSLEVHTNLKIRLEFYVKKFLLWMIPQQSIQLIKRK